MPDDNALRELRTLTPRQYLTVLINALDEPCDVYGAATDEPEGARYIRLSTSLLHTIVTQGRAVLDQPGELVPGLDLTEIPPRLMADAGWYKFIDGRESRERARALVLRWYTHHRLHLPAVILEDLERRLAAQMDVEMLVWVHREHHQAEPPSDQSR